MSEPLPPDVEAVALNQVRLMLDGMREYLNNLPLCVPYEAHEVAREASYAVLQVEHVINGRLRAITDPEDKLDGY